jgi:hypothetical protein
MMMTMMEQRSFIAIDKLFNPFQSKSIERDASERELLSVSQ